MIGRLGRLATERERRGQAQGEVELALRFARSRGRRSCPGSAAPWFTAFPTRCCTRSRSRELRSRSCTNAVTRAAGNDEITRPASLSRRIDSNGYWGLPRSMTELATADENSELDRRDHPSADAKGAILERFRAERTRVFTRTVVVVGLSFAALLAIAVKTATLGLYAVAGSSLIAAAGWIGARLGEVGRQRDLQLQELKHADDLEKQHTRHREQLDAREKELYRQQRARAEAALALLALATHELEFAARLPPNHPRQLEIRASYSNALDRYLEAVIDVWDEVERGRLWEVWRILAYAVDHPSEVNVDFRAMRTEVANLSGRLAGELSVVNVRFGELLARGNAFRELFAEPSDHLRESARSEIQEFTTNRWPIEATTRLQGIVAACWAAVLEWRAVGYEADLHVYGEGRTDCPKALAGHSLPLVVMTVERTAVLVDHAMNGLFFITVPVHELDGPPLPVTQGWTQLEEPDNPYPELHRELVKRIAGGWMQVQPQ